jgi:hypothetical protein
MGIGCRVHVRWRQVWPRRQRDQWYCRGWLVSNGKIRRVRIQDSCAVCGQIQDYPPLCRNLVSVPYDDDGNVSPSSLTLFHASFGITQPGQRLFCILIEEGSGQEPSNIELDLLTKVPQYTAYTMDVYFNVSSDKVLNIRFKEWAPYDKPKISAVEIYEVK